MKKRDEIKQKRDVIKQKQKLKKVDDFKWIKYASYMCIAMVVLFLVYAYMLAMTTKGGIETLIVENLFVTVGFIVCAGNLFVWNEIKRILTDLHEFKNIEATKAKLILIAVAELIMFNYATAALVFFSLYNYFKWKGTSLKEMYDEIVKTKQLKSLILLFVVLVVFVSLTYVIAMAALTL